MIADTLRLEIYDTDGTTMLDASCLPIRASLLWPLNAVSSAMVDLAAVDPAVASLDVGHIIHLVGPEGNLFIGTIRDMPSARVLDDTPSVSIEVLNNFDDLNLVDVMRRWWNGAGTMIATILGTGHTGAPPGLLHDTGWTLNIELAVGQRVRVEEFIWGSLLRCIVRTIEDGAAAWWADPITKTLYVGEFGADSGIVVARPDSPDPLLTRDATVLWATRISKEVTGPMANRIFGIGAELDADPWRVRLPYPKPAWGGYTVVEIAGHMTDQLEYYIQDAASIAAYGVLEYSLVDRSIDIDNGLALDDAQLHVYSLCEAAMKRWKDKVRFYTVDIVGNQIDSIGRATVTLGSKVRLVFNGYLERTHPVTQESLGSTYETINELLFVTSVERNWDERGVEMVRLLLADSLQLAPVTKYPGGPGKPPIRRRRRGGGDERPDPGW